MAPSPEEAPDRTELSNGKAKRLINFIKSNTEKDNPDHLLAKGIEKRVQDGQPNWEESQALKQEYESFVPQQKETKDDTPKMFNEEAHEKLDFLATKTKATQVKPFKDPNEVTVDLVEDTPAPPSSPDLKPNDLHTETINPPKTSQAVSKQSQEQSVELGQMKQPEVKETAANKPMETNKIFNLLQTAI
ncbi:hypothetical protein DSO57_1038548 [Entomophthora muscae]|uniref:Uncharacterized protein n=1 Tax=Entomophthora muscae TaxID=34485 RepID=A0ACC2TX81_9FUNG|nr:hypothetical protein DSO57_1038548 [Entomophthora muscae]